jgi:hypothetical protein
MCAQGADVIDVGGESTRPGSEEVSAAEEKARVIPVIKELSAEITVPISIDTRKAEVAAAALDVFEHEPPTEAETALINHPRVSASPHIGGSTVEAQDRVGTEIAIKVVKALSPEKLM